MLQLTDPQILSLTVISRPLSLCFSSCLFSFLTFYHALPAAHKSVYSVIQTMNSMRKKMRACKSMWALCEISYHNVSLSLSVLDWFSHQCLITLRQCSPVMSERQNKRRSKWRVWIQMHYGSWYSMLTQVCVYLEENVRNAWLDVHIRYTL